MADPLSYKSKSDESLSAAGTNSNDNTEYTENVDTGSAAEFIGGLNQTSRGVNEREETKKICT